MSILKLLALFVAIWWTMVNTAKLFRGHRIPTWNFIFQAAGVATFVYLQWLM